MRGNNDEGFVLGRHAEETVSSFCVHVCMQFADILLYRLLTLSPWFPSLATRMRYKIYHLETTAKHDYLSQLNWKDSEMQKPAGRQCEVSN